MKWKDLSLKERKQIYDSVRVNNPDATYFDIKEQFDSIPAYEDGGKSIVDEVNKSDANFVQRLKSPTRQTIPNWEDQYRVLPWEKSVSTHKLSVWDNANGGGIIVPDVQEVNGKLIDFTRPPYNNRAAVENALKTGDYVDLPKFEDALWYTENYKRYYPRFEDGGKNKNVPVLPKELGLTPGTPEYLERQKRISGSANVVQPEAYITPAGYIKDAVNFIEDLGKGDYAGAAMDAVLNLIPWGVGKTIKKFKNKVGRAIEGTDVYTTESYAEPFTPTITKKKGKSKVSKPSEEAENSETIRLARNRSKYETEISRSISDAVFPDSETYELLNYVDNTYKTNYKSAYSNIAMRDMTNRGKYLSWGTMDNNAFGNTKFKIEPDGNTSRVMQDYKVTLNPDSYMSGTANHELGHVADGLAGSRKIVDFDGGGEYITNPYLHYLANPNNTYSSAELRKMGMHSAANNRAYLLNPTEAKSHMLTLKRALKDSGKITNWSTPVDESMVLEYIKSPTPNKLIKDQYNLYRNKNEYIERLNKLIPMEILMPLGGAGFVGNELNKE